MKIINRLFWNWEHRLFYQCECSPRIWFNLRQNNCLFCDKPIERVKERDFLLTLLVMFDL